MSLFKKLRKKLTYLDEGKIEDVHRAYLVAYSAHEGQKRYTGEPYISHPVAVCCILAEMKMDPPSLMAALLHDVIEDTPITKDALEVEFGEVVANLVDGVSKLTQIEIISRAEAQAENFRKMVLAMGRDIRVILIKLADRLHNMRTIGSFRPEKRRRIAKETLEIYAPVAKRLGMRSLSVELEEFSFMAMYPRRYAILHEAVREARSHRKKVLEMIQQTIEKGIANSHLPSCTLVGREKHLFSIYRKMRNKRISFNDIMDVYAFRIIVENRDMCYRMLGLMHSLFKPVPERFKDYIAIPKANGYQSLHTTLFGPFGLPIEIQIRTQEMDRMANNGIAAHWLYKSGDQPMDESKSRAQQWVKNLLELQENTGSSLEFIESVKIDLYPDEVYVFTPTGDIMELPANAIAIDFAYAVHTDVGNHCIGVKIDRKPAPLMSTLISGQTVEVITAPHARPNPAWLDFVVTSKARSGIRLFLRSQRRKESIALGKDLLKQALSEYKLSLKKTPEHIMQFIIQEAGLQTLDELFIEIGLGNRVAILVAQRIFDKQNSSGLITLQLEKINRTPLVIKGTESMVLQFAECCCPIPGDPIVGILDIGKGIVVHLENCRRIEKLRRYPERFMILRWSDQVKQDFKVNIKILAHDQPRLLASLALGISNADSNILDIQVNAMGSQQYSFTFKLAVHNRIHLAKVIRNIRRIPAVIRINRSSA